MALQLTLQTGLDTPVPYGFTRGDAGDLCYFLRSDPDQAIAETFSFFFRIDLSPLFMVVTQEEDGEGWQSLATLEECLRDFGQLLANYPGHDPFGSIEAMRSQFASRYNPSESVADDRYFTEGGLQHDLSDLLRMVEWARQQGAAQGRLVAQ